MSTVKIAFLLFSIICVSQQQQGNGTCSDVQLKLEALSETVQTLCGSSTASPSVTTQPPPAAQCDCAPPVNWTSTVSSIGSTSIKSAGTLAYDIPSVIPSSAKEVLIFANVEVGNSGPSSQQHYIKIYTQQGSQQFEKYIFVVTYPQNARSTNSDNLWFPMTTGRQVFVELGHAHTGHINLYLFAIGYR